MTKCIFDLDGTLTREESLPRIAEHFGIGSEMETLTREAVLGKIPFWASFQKRVHLLKTLPVREVADVLYDIPLYEGLIGFIARYSGSCAVATSNLSCWVERLAERIPCEVYASAPKLEEGRLLGIETLLDKAAIVRDWQREGHRVIFIGDGSNDASAMELADIAVAAGITHRPAEAVLDVADYHFQDVDNMVETLEHIMSETTDRSETTNPE
ncbi:hypothetical protein TAMA11512_20920 [Selenomonas sp. TAMA-11512]|uniref:HAD family hydrolase n=1 Tax=Selenomonas sp. TAMA-11512 TaxID=3095337 RepID=UPI003092DC7B|nr:hypothetical protein TAMA11512_20920 [Selenomonas sp. TAMA-11512]